jgi:hypothetical protein
MTTVDLPGGDTINFPDNMSDDEINAATQQHLYHESWRGQINDTATNAATGILKGVGNVGGLPHVVAGLGDAAPGYGGLDVTGQPMTPYQGPPQMGPPGFLTRHTYSPEEINSGIFSAIDAMRAAVGNPERGPYVPQTAAGRIGQEALSQAIPSLVGGAETAVPRMIAGMTSGGAGQAVSEVAPNAPGWVRPAVSMATGLATGRLAGPRATSPTTDAMTRLGMTPMRQDVNAGPLTQLVAANVTKLPGSGGYRAAQARNLDQWGNQLENTAADLGASTNPQEAGTALQVASGNWMDQFRANSRQAWNNVDMLVPGATPVPVTNYARTLNQVRSQMAGAPATADVLQSPLSRNLLDALISDARIGRPLDWDTVRGMRTRIGDMLTDTNLIGDTNYGELRRIYGALSEDLRGAVHPLGSDAVDAYNAANNLTRAGHSFIDDTVSKYLAPRPGMITPEAAYTRAMSGSASGGTGLQAIRDEMPGAADELAAAHLRLMGLATPGQRAAPNMGPMVSPNTFLTNTNRLSPQAFDALYGADPGVAGRIADLRTVGSSMRDTARFANTSNTAPVASLLSVPSLAMGAAGGALAKGYSLPTALLAGGAMGATPLAAGYLGSRYLRSVPRTFSPGALPVGAVPGLLQ